MTNIRLKTKLTRQKSRNMISPSDGLKILNNWNAQKTLLCFAALICSDGAFMPSARIVFIDSSVVVFEYEGSEGDVPRDCREVVMKSARGDKTILNG